MRHWGLGSAWSLRILAPMTVVVVAMGATAIPVAAAIPPAFISMFGEEGDGPGQFSVQPWVAVDAQGDIFATDSDHNRVFRFSADGILEATWGTLGDGDSELNKPAGIAIGPNGKVWVVDGYNHRIVRFTRNGAYEAQWGEYGSGDGQFGYPAGIAIAANGNIFVADAGNDRVQRFDANGNFEGEWGTPEGSDWTDPGEFYAPLGVAVSPTSGHVYVADTNNARVQWFTQAGGYLGSWGEYGGADGQFAAPQGIVVGTDGDVYVIDRKGGATPGGQRFSSTGDLEVVFRGPLAWKWRTVDIDGNGDLIIGGNRRIERWGVRQPDGRVRIGTSGAFVGDGVYNTTGASQAKTGSAKPGKTVTFNVSIGNDGKDTDRFKLKGAGGTSAFGVVYKAGATTITPAVVAGTWKTRALAPGASQVITVIVSVKPGAPTGATLVRTLRATSTDAATQTDVVKLTVKRS